MDQAAVCVGSSAGQAGVAAAQERGAWCPSSSLPHTRSPPPKAQAYTARTHAAGDEEHGGGIVLLHDRQHRLGKHKVAASKVGDDLAAMRSEAAERCVGCRASGRSCSKPAAAGGQQVSTAQHTWKAVRGPHLSKLVIALLRQQACRWVGCCSGLGGRPALQALLLQLLQAAHCALVLPPARAHAHVLRPVSPLKRMTRALLIRTSLPPGAEAADGMVDRAMLLHHICHKGSALVLLGNVSHNNREQALQRRACRVGAWRRVQAYVLWATLPLPPPTTSPPHPTRQACHRMPHSKRAMYLPWHSFSRPSRCSSRRSSATTFAPSINSCRLMPLPTMPLAPADSGKGDGWCGTAGRQRELQCRWREAAAARRRRRRRRRRVG